MKYYGIVTDRSWIQSFIRLPAHRRKEFNKTKIDKKVEDAFNYIFSLNRMPRIYEDEYKLK